MLCSWSMEGEGRIWLLVDGKGVSAKFPPAQEAGPQIPCYKIFLGGSYFPEVYCPTARALLDEFRISDESVARGWAEQYGDDGKPAWARDFEPPAACMSSIDDAADALLLLYDLTGEDKYLAPLRTCVGPGNARRASRHPCKGAVR